MFINGKEVTAPPHQRSFVTQENGEPPRPIPAYEGDNSRTGLSTPSSTPDGNGPFDNVRPYKVPWGHYFHDG